MSWAAGRKTSRAEDRTYSLLGIFGVNMPLLYGEGDNAFTRLLEQLVQTSTDHSVFAWQKQYEDTTSDVFEDMLFARSPDDFRLGKRIVHWKSNVPDSHYRLTNKGVEFKAPLFVESQFGCFAVLNCRLEDDLRGPLALRLGHKDRFPFALVNNNDFWVAGDIRTSNMPDQLPVQSKRLIVYGGFEATEQYDRTITVLRYLPYSSLVYHSLKFSSLKICVKQSSSSAEEFEIIAASPKKAWNRATGVMCSPFREERRTHIVCSATLRFKQSRAILSVALRAPVIVTAGFLTKKAVDKKSEYFIAMCQSSDQAQARHELTKVAPSSATQVTDESGNCYSALVEVSRIMGDDVCVIEVSKESTSPCRFNELQQPVAAKRRRLH
jgi:hypothetical protein